MKLLAATALCLALFISCSDAEVSLDSNLQIGLGSQLALHCTAKPEQSLQVSQFSWEFNGETFETSTDPNSHISRMGNKETLTRFNVQFEHAGSYRCRAHYSNGTIEDSNERQVMVVTTPVIEAVSPLYVEVNTDAHLTCSVNTSVTIRWLAANMTAFSSGGRYRIVNNGSTVKLVIAMVTMEDTGEYICEASNGVMAAKRTVQLHPYVPSAPILRPLVERVSVDKGSSFNLTCRVYRQFPLPQLSWSHNGDNITTQLDDSVTVVEEVDAVTLVVMATTFDLRGRYTCTARNSLGTDSSSTEVIISGKPDVTVSPSQISAAAGSSVIFNCSAFAVPGIVSFQWTLPSGSPLPTTTGSKYVRVGMTLTVNALSSSDNGMYGCEVNNSRGTTRGEATLMVVELPPKPNGIAATSPIGQRNVTLEWTKPTDVSANQKIDHFVIIYQLPGSSEVHEAATVSPDLSSFEVTTLLPGTTHTVWVVSRNAAGDSPKSNSVNVTTLPSAPSVAMFRATSLFTGRRILLEWELEYDGGADITGYVVEYRRSNSDSWVALTDTVDAYSGTHCVSGLRPETEYMFRLQFENRHGTSQQMHSQATTSLGVPGQPSRPIVSSVSSTSVTLSLTFTDLGSGDLLRVVTNITQTSNGHTSTQDRLIGSPKANQTVLLAVTNLLPSTQYTFRVAGMNSVGTGEFSAQTDAVITEISLYYIIAAGVGGFLLVLVVLCCVAVIVTCCCRNRQHGAWDTKAAMERPNCKSPVLAEPIPSRSDLGLELSYNPLRINSRLSDHISPFSHDTMPREPPPYILPPPLFESDNRFRSHSTSHLPTLFEMKQTALERDESEWYLKGCSQPDSVYPRCSDEIPDYVNFSTDV